MKDSELKDYTFKCPKCQSVEAPLIRGILIRNEPLRECSSIHCTFAWIAEDDHLYMTKKVIDQYQRFNDALKAGKRVFVRQVGGNQMGKMLELNEARRIHNHKSRVGTPIDRSVGLVTSLFIEGDDIVVKKPAPEGYEHIDECREVRKGEFMLTNDGDTAWSYDEGANIGLERKCDQAFRWRWILRKKPVDPYAKYRAAEAQGIPVYCFDYELRDVNRDAKMPDSGWGYIDERRYAIAGVDVPVRPTPAQLEACGVELTGYCQLPQVGEYWINDTNQCVWLGSNIATRDFLSADFTGEHGRCPPSECVTFGGRRWLVRLKPAAVEAQQRQANKLLVAEAQHAVDVATKRLQELQRSL